MKSTKLLTLLAVFASPMTFGIDKECPISPEDYLNGSCTYTLSGNDVGSFLFSEDDRKIKELKKSTFTEHFKICNQTVYARKQNYIRVIPYNSDVNKVADYQITAFSNDESLRDIKTVAEDNEVPIYTQLLSSTTHVSISYGGKNEVLNNTSKKAPQVKLNFRTERHEFEGATFSKRIKSDNGRTRRISYHTDVENRVLKEGKTEKFSFPDQEVSFEYLDLPGDGILGIFGGTVTEEELVEANKAKRKIHKAKLKVECSVSLPEKEEEEELEEVTVDGNEDEEEVTAISPFAGQTTFGPGSDAVEN